MEEYENNPIETIARGVCVVDGKTLSAKGESAVAKAGSVITLNPDWKFEVVSASK